MNSYNKSQIALSFNKASHSYDAAATLQYTVGKNLLAQIDTAEGYILDIGAGTGKITQELQKKFPHAKVLAIDIAYDMLKLCSVDSICADADALPIKSNSIDLIFSNLMMQWSPNFSHTLRELHRVLKPSGKIIYSTLGPNTLKELRACWGKIDNCSHVHEFIQKEKLNGYFKSETYTLQFSSVHDLMLSLKNLGAHNLNHSRQRGLTGKNKIKQLIALYENFRDDSGNIPASYEVFYVLCQK